MVPFERRTLGRTGVDVGALGYGAMELRGPPRGREVSEAEAARLLHAVLDAGIDLIDTAIDYGISEERIGRHLAHRRDEFFLASKCGCLVGWVPTAQGGGPHEFTRANVVAGVDQSLRRLRTDHLDCVQVHSSPSQEQIEEDGLVETLRDLQQQGKVRFLGMSGTLPHVRDHIAMGVFDVFQVPYSLLQPEYEAVVAEAAAAGAGVIARGAVGKGAPSGAAERVRRYPDLAAAWGAARLDDLLDGTSPTGFLLRFALGHPGVSTAIVGTLSPAHVQDNVRAVSEGPLPPDVHEEARRRLVT